MLGGTQERKSFLTRVKHRLPFWERTVQGNAGSSSTFSPSESLHISTGKANLVPRSGRWPRQAKSRAFRVSSGL